MKNLRMTLSAVAVFAVVGSALAFKTFTQQDIFRCVSNKCIKFADQLPYSSLQSDVPVTPPSTPFKGIENQACNLPSSPCQPYTGQVYLND